jgi:hypothetical protein
VACCCLSLCAEAGMGRTGKSMQPVGCGPARRRLAASM